MGHLRQDLGWALRTMNRNRLLAATVVLSLGLAIGVNTAVFSVANAFLLRPLPIREVSRLVRLWENRNAPGEEPETRPVADGNYALWQQYNTVFSGMGACTDLSMNLTGAGKPERLHATAINVSFFPLLDVAPILGRNIRPEEDRPGQGHVVILSNALWASHFGADPRILGKALTLDGAPYTVIGVMRPKFRYPYDADLWVPLASDYSLARPGNFRLYVIGRLKPGVTIERAGVELSRLVQRLAKERPSAAAPKSAHMIPLTKQLIHDLDRLIFLLLGGAGFVLLIACANVSNLLLAQSVTRGGEMAVRIALGASRRRLLRQFLTYTILLALLGGAVGVLLTFWSIHPLVALSPLESIRDFDAEPRIDLATLGFTLAVSLLVGVVFGAVPALRASSFRLNDLLKEEGRSRTLGGAARRVVSSFVVAEVALAMVLLVGAGLMLRSFMRSHDADRGFRIAGVLTFKASVGGPRYAQPPAVYALLHDVTERLKSLPGVVAAGATTTQPLEPGQEYVAFNVEGKPPAEASHYQLAHTRTITPDYFKVMKIPLLAGRELGEHDDAHAQEVIVVSKSFADRYWPGQVAIGKRIKRGLYTSHTPWLTVVGVVGTVAETPEADPEASTVDAVYFPYSQTTSGHFDDVTFVARTSADPKGLIEPARQAVSAVDKDEPIYDVATLAERLEKMTVQDKFSALLYGILGTLGLLLSTLGIYGVLSFSVSQRLREFGIRAAMGASPGAISAMVLRHALVLALAGLAIGTATALALSRLLAKLLHEVSPRDPLTLLGALAALAVIALVSSYLPARRAARLDAIQALRHE
jgi:putative ABC transport system permease protein